MGAESLTETGNIRKFKAKVTSTENNSSGNGLSDLAVVGLEEALLEI